MLVTEQLGSIELPPVEQPVPHVHVVGAGGAGMSAIATVLVQIGYRVSGSDRVASDALDRLGRLGVETFVGHSGDHIGDASVVTASTAVPSDNPEIVAAADAGAPVWSRAQILGALTRRQPTLAIAGTHGKTTTSSMLAVAFSRAGLQPSFVIGAHVRALGHAARWEAGAPWFIVEADESDGTFLDLARAGAVVTSVEPDHVGHYGSIDRLVAAFERFVAETDGPVAACIDDAGARRVVERTDHPSVVTYGTSADAEVRIDGHVGARASSRQTLHFGGTEVELELAVPGLHNVRNAAGAFAIAAAVGADPAVIADGLRDYTGVARRFEFRGDHNDVTFVDDYAHLPSEIEAALAAAVDGGWRRIVVVFQPHRYTRTADLHASFGPAFAAADHVVVTGIYSSGERPIEGVTAALVVDSIREAAPHRRVDHVEPLADLPEHLAAVLRPGDLCLTLGAGDLTTLPDIVLERLGSEGR